MKLSHFIQDKLLLIIFNLFCITLLVIFLYLLNIGAGEQILVSSIWIMILFCRLYYLYYIQKKELSNLHRILDSLDKKYLFIEMLEKPISPVKYEYYVILRQALKSMTEHVSQTEREMVEYRQFIEQWVHEMKRPVTATELICENSKNIYTQKIRYQMEAMEHHIERVLYYARLGHVENDYFISEFFLDDIIEEALSRNKLLFIQNNVLINTHDLKHCVYTDKKWIIFILNQILTNSVQYKKEDLKITIFAQKDTTCIKLIVRDNGIGIKESEIDRIFQLGFTGSNGRNSNNSTGIGLYLCYSLCQKLEIDIAVSSRINKYTEITLSFSLNSLAALQKQP